MEFRTRKLDLFKERDHVRSTSLIEAPSGCQHVHLVEHLEQRRRRLMYGAYYRPSLSCQYLQQLYALLAGRTVQPTERNNYEFIIIFFLFGKTQFLQHCFSVIVVTSYGVQIKYPK